MSIARACARVPLVPMLLVLTVAGAPSRTDADPQSTTLSIRGHEQTLRLYGSGGQRVAIVASGDGGWVHLGPDVAGLLSGQGWRVVGFDSKAYLSSFTTKQSTLSPADVAADFAVLVDRAATLAPTPPVLIGISEGAGLAVLAAADPAVKSRIGGVVGLGLPDQCELGWRFRDSLIYLTKGVPKEPMFSTAEVIGAVAPLPVVAIHSTRDEYVPADEVKGVMAKAGEPSQLWFVDARNHRFSGNTGEFGRKLHEALEWIEEHRR
jgi:pimeloyl-ACP methyl ester carboxylesterase